MQSQADAQQDRTTEPTPPVRPRATCRVADVGASPGFRLRVWFNDGTAGIVDIADFMLPPPLALG
jgi:hypothetical protein